jgi:hypothetical protein
MCEVALATFNGHFDWPTHIKATGSAGKYLTGQRTFCAVIVVAGGMDA